MDKLKKFRNEIGLTQKAMAKELGITLSMYEKVEGGRAKVSSKFMKRFKHRFPACSLDDIFFTCESNDVAEGESVRA